MAYIRKSQPVTNLGKRIEFELCEVRLVRCLVMTVHAIGEEVSVASPVGAQLANAKPGDVLQVHQMDDGYLFGKVLSITDSVAPVAA